MEKPKLTSYEKVPRLSAAELLNPNQMSIYDELGRVAVYEAKPSKLYTGWEFNRPVKPLL